MQYRATITIDHTKVSGSGDLTDFPVLISGIYDGTGGEPDLRSAANGGDIQNVDTTATITGADSAPADLAFYNDENLTVQYDHEVQFYDPTTGQFVAHVRIPTLDGDADTVFYMHYGNAAITTSQENIAGVWDANYISVWHMAQSGNGTANEFKDSAGSHHGTGGGGVSGNTPTRVAGAFGYAQQSDGADYIRVTDHADFDISGSITFEGLYYPTTSASFYWLMCKGDGSVGYNWAAYIEQTNRRFNVPQPNPNTFTAGGVPLNQWNHLGVTFNSSTGTEQIIMNGAATQNTSQSMGSTNNFPLYLGWNNLAGQEMPNGNRMQEYRVSSVARSNDWMFTTQATLLDSAFYTMGNAVSSDIVGPLPMFRPQINN